MGREVRRVPATWEHPTRHTFDVRGNWVERHIPLREGFEAAAKRWDAEHAKWLAGTHPDQEEIGTTERDFDEWDGGRPQASEYMPDWPEAERTHYQLYETTSEGTPASPVFATMDELLDYAAENCTTFASFKATREEWAAMLGQGTVGHTVEAADGSRTLFC